MGRSGFVTLVGRPNVGKSSLLNRMVGAKVSIVSDKVQTTRSQVRGVLHRGGDQVVFVDTPGMHRPRGPLGPRLAETASAAVAGVDLVCVVLDATASLGPGDRAVAAQVPARPVVVLNKIDRASPSQVMAGLAAAAQLEAADYYPVSARTGEGVDQLIDGLVDRLPEGPAYYPSDARSDVPEAVWVAELVREQLLAVLHDELPHAVATRVTEWEWPRIRCEILVQRASQKGIVIGHGGRVLKEVGTAVRRQLAPGAYLELMVKVDKDWPLRPLLGDDAGR
ncbi:MAG TPA: GTPase Era [Acidimicrobiales bacterium]|nr:GTPase Era [Acidimicrobiales bacterium]